MNGHPQFEEDFDLHALGVLEGEEKQAFETHLKSCPECVRKAEAARGRVALLGLAAPLLSPPPRVKERLLHQIGVRPVPEPAPKPSLIWRWAIPVLALASLVLAVSTIVLRNQTNELNRRLAELEAAHKHVVDELGRARIAVELLTTPETLKVTLVAGQARPVPQGKVFFHPNKGLVFYAANLPSLPVGKTYQLWLVPMQGAPISAGIFQADASGNGAVVLPPLPAGVPAKAFAVTVEPAGGVPQPTGTKVLVGLVS